MTTKTSPARPRYMWHRVDKGSPGLTQGGFYQWTGTPSRPTSALVVIARFTDPCKYGGECADPNCNDAPGWRIGTAVYQDGLDVTWSELPVRSTLRAAKVAAEKKYFPAAG